MPWFRITGRVIKSPEQLMDSNSKYNTFYRIWYNICIKSLEFLKKCIKTSSFSTFFQCGISFLNIHFKGFGAISRSRGCRVLKTVHFGIGDIPKCPTDESFIRIVVFFAISVGRRLAAGALFFVVKNLKADASAAGPKWIGSSIFSWLFFGYLLTWIFGHFF